MKLNFRQGIVRCQTDNANNPLFLQRAGQSVNLSINASSTVLAFAHKDANYLYTEDKSVPGAWVGPFVSGRNYWLYWDLNLITGIRSFGHTNFLPIVSPVAPLLPVSDQHWFDLSTTTMKVWVGTWNPVVRVFAAKYVNATSFESILKPITSVFVGSQGQSNVISTPGSIIFDSTGKPIKTSDGTFFTSETSAIVNGTSSSVSLSALLTEGEALEPIPQYSMVYFSEFNKIRLATNSIDPHVPVGIVEVNLPTGQISRVIYQGLVVNTHWNWSTINAPLYIVDNGTLSMVPTKLDQGAVAYVISPTSIMLMSFQLARGTTGQTGQTGQQGNNGTSAADVLLSSGTVFGKTRLSLAPTDLTDPIAVGNNDTRMSNARNPLPHSHNLPYDIAYSVPGNYTKANSVSKTVGIFLSPRSVYLPANYTESIAKHQGTINSAAPQTTCDFIIRKNGIEFGRVQFSNNNNNGTFISSNGSVPIFVARGDIIDVISPPTINTFCANVSITIVGCSIASECNYVIAP